MAFKIIEKNSGAPSSLQKSSSELSKFRLGPSSGVKFVNVIFIYSCLRLGAGFRLSKTKNQTRAMSVQTVVN